MEQSYYDPPFRPYRDALTGIFVNHPEIVISARGFLLSGVLGYKFFDLSVSQQFNVINDRLSVRFQNIMVPVGSFAASMLPTSDALNIGSGIMTGHDMEGNRMDVGSYVMAGIGFVPFGKVAKYSKAVFAASGGSNLALGLGHDLFRFAEIKGFDTYRSFSTGFQKDKILDAMQSYDKIHFNVTDFGKYRFSKFDPTAPLSYNNYTNWEMHTIYNNPNLLNKTTFYRYVGTEYVIMPNYSPYFK